MTSCTIRWCGKNSKTSGVQKDGITFHRYPTDPDIKNTWINKTRRENWFPARHSVICSRHFTEDCFIYMKNRRRLLSSAVPTLYLPLIQDDVVDPDADVPMPTTSKQEPLVKIKGLSSKVILDTPKIKRTNSPTSTSRLMPKENSLKSPSYTEARKQKPFPGSPTDYTSPVKKRLCRRILELSEMVMQKNKCLKNLREKSIYMRKRLVSLKNILTELEKQ